jgi:hypothetical protein
MKLLLHSESISERGDSTNAEAYCRGLKEFFDVDSIIVYKANSKANNSSRITEIASKYKIEPYHSQKDLHAIGKNFGATHSYFMNSGVYSAEWVKNTKRISHAVFNYFEPHGDIYAYCSKYLMNAALKSKNRSTSSIKNFYKRAISRSPYRIDYTLQPTYVSHCVYTEEASGLEFRLRYKIPTSAFLVGRIGGLTQFDDPAAQQAVKILLEKKDYFFCFVNTLKFVDHPRAIFIDYLSNSQKWSFYEACDLLLNGRLMGETFGFSIVEPLMLGKPVIAPAIIRNPKMDKNHIEILGSDKYLYDNSNDLAEKVDKFRNGSFENFILLKLVEQFKPEVVIKTFYENFLSDAKVI